MSEICSKQTARTHEWRQWSRSGVFIDKQTDFTPCSRFSTVFIESLLWEDKCPMGTSSKNICLLVPYLKLSLTFESASRVPE